MTIGQPQQPGEPDGGATWFVGLDRAVQSIAHLIEVLVDGRLGGGPDARERLRAARARIERGQPRRLTGENEVMERAHHAQLRHRARRGADSGEQARHPAASVDVVGGRAHQSHVEGRAARAHERLGVAAKTVGQAPAAGLGVAGAAVGKLRVIGHCV